MKGSLALTIAATLTFAAATAGAQDRVYKTERDGDRDDVWWDDDRLHKDNGDWYEGWSEIRFRGLDRNRDGRISRSEWRGNRTSFERMDRNNDGVLSGNEVRRSSRGNRGRRGGRDEDRVRYGNRDRAASQLFDGWDRNRDGRITRSEWPGDARSFADLDRNRDGRLTRDEVRNRISFD